MAFVLFIVGQKLVMTVMDIPARNGISRGEFAAGSMAARLRPELPHQT